MPDVLVLCYHAVSPTWQAPLSVTPGSLETQLSFLLARGYRGVTFTEAATTPPDGRTLAVTFDDAYGSTLERGLPILDRLGVPGTVFVPTDYAGASRPIAWDGMEHWVGGDHEPELRCMTIPELASLRDAGWEVGSHTCSHPRLSQLDDAELDGELARSKAELEAALDFRCTSLAYPYGDFDGRVALAAERAGYSAACTLVAHEARPQPLTWPRVAAYHSDSLGRFRLKVSPWARRARVAEARTRLLGALRRG